MMPLGMSLAPITDLLTPTYFPNDPNITAKQAGLISFLNNTYCGLVPNCAVPPAPTPPPIPPTGLWSQYMGNAQHTGLSLLTGLQGPNVGVLWSLSNKDSVGMTDLTSIVVGLHGTIYYLCVSGVIAVAGSPGVTKWQYPFPGGNNAMNGALAVGSSEDVYGCYDSVLFALDGVTGELLWTYQSGGIYSCYPTLGPDGTVFLGGTSDDTLYAIVGGRSGGALKWKTSLGAAVDAYPAMDAEGIVYVSAGACYALDGATGEVQWKSTGIVSAPVVGANGTVYGECGAGVCAVSSKTGLQLWQWSSTVSVASLGFVSGPTGLLFVACDDSNLYAIDTVSGIPAWSYVLHVAKPAMAIGSDGTVYLSSNGGTAAVSKSGSLLWSETSSGCDNSFMSTAIAIGPNGVLFCLNLSGVVAVGNR